jgi:hypothetical protein
MGSGNWEESLPRIAPEGRGKDFDWLTLPVEEGSRLAANDRQLIYHY